MSRSRVGHKESRPGGGEGRDYFQTWQKATQHLTRQCFMRRRGEELDIKRKELGEADKGHALKRRTCVLQNHHKHALLGEPRRDTAFHLYGSVHVLVQRTRLRHLEHPWHRCVFPSIWEQASVMSKHYEGKSELDNRLT